MTVIASILGMLAAFVMGWYLCRETYAPQLTFTQDWVLRLVEEFAESMDTALHMKKEENYVVDTQHEAVKQAVKLPVIEGDLGAFIDRIESPEIREIATHKSQVALMRGIDSFEILERLRIGQDPLWAQAIGD
jgi:hypothetical protein